MTSLCASFLILANGDNNDINFIGVLGQLNELIYIKHLK